MHLIAVMLTKVLGGVAIFFTLVWGLLAFFWTGDLFAGTSGVALLGLLALLVLGPFSIYPMALVGSRRPGIAGAWLLFLGVVPVLVLLLIPGGRKSDAMLPLLAACAPLSLLGLAFLKVWRDLRTKGGR